MEPKHRLIFPLDFPDKAAAFDYINRLHNEVGLFKVGWELFMAEGPKVLEDMVNELSDPGRFFLDLKLLDIPTTIRGALSTIVHGLALTTVHCDIGFRGLQEIAQTASKVVAVTLLTSLNEEDLSALGYDPKYTKEPTELVLKKAKLAQEAGCHGVVCSGREARAVKETCGPDFLVVCPGIRPQWASVAGDDQQRVITPYEAIKNGADYIVVGRPIRRDPDPVAAARRVVEEIATGLKERAG